MSHLYLLSPWYSDFRINMWSIYTRLAWSLHILYLHKSYCPWLGCRYFYQTGGIVMKGGPQAKEDIVNLQWPRLYFCCIGCLYVLYSLFNIFIYIVPITTYIWLYTFLFVFFKCNSCPYVLYSMHRSRLLCTLFLLYLCTTSVYSFCLYFQSTHLLRIQSTQTSSILSYFEECSPGTLYRMCHTT